MRFILPVIVISQFLCTSVWFTGNSVSGDIVKALHLPADFVVHLTSAIQTGFIAGTLVFAIFTIADRFSPSLVFFISSILAAVVNMGMTLSDLDSTAILFFRFLTGFFLAGIYPVGMKIASDHYREGLGRSLGFLVGALVVGTALPHLLKNITQSFPWRNVVYATSSLSIAGGLLLFLLIPDGPFRKAGQKINFTAFMHGFRRAEFRSVAFGYFGHMWELYTFWAFVPAMIMRHKLLFTENQVNISLFSFLIIASGGLACVFSGLLSQYFNPKKIATLALILSCACCFASPFFLFTSSPSLFLGFLFFWGLTVIADSPLFSTLVARSAPEESRGTSLTIVNCIGFAITIVSIQFINLVWRDIDARYIFVLLGIGPVLGLYALIRVKRQ